MRRIATAISVVLALTQFILCQPPAAKWEVGTIVNVTQVSGGAGHSEHYDVSIQVGDIIYVVRYEQKPGTTLVQYKKGLQTTVLVGEKTIKANDIRGIVREAPIISKKNLAKESALP